MSSSKPEWLGILEQQLEENPKYKTYALATLSPDGKPKVRHVIHRGITPSGLLLTTTDTRMQKPNHLKHDPAVEFAWWIEESAIQFRATGPAVTIPHEASSVEAELKKLSVSPEAEDGKGDWWVEKRNEIWGKEMSGHLRGSFGRPPPGKPLSEIEEKPENWITRLDEKSDDPKQQKDIDYALSHFAVIAIKVDEFEVLELKPVPNKRTQWKRNAQGEWDQTKVAP